MHSEGVSIDFSSHAFARDGIERDKDSRRRAQARPARPHRREHAGHLHHDTRLVVSQGPVCSRSSHRSKGTAEYVIRVHTNAQRDTTADLCTSHHLQRGRRLRARHGQGHPSAQDDRLLAGSHQRHSPPTPLLPSVAHKHGCHEDTNPSRPRHHERRRCRLPPKLGQVRDYRVNRSQGYWLCLDVRGIGCGFGSTLMIAYLTDP